MIGKDIYKFINKDLLDYYFTPGKIYDLFKFSNEFKINLTEVDLKELINLIINDNLYKKDTSLKYLVYDFIELYLLNNISLKSYDFFDYFISQIDKTKRFNLDEESLFLNFKSEFSNG